MINTPSFGKTYLYTLAPQLVLCVVYWVFGVNRSGSRNPFGEVVLDVYSLGAIPAMVLGSPGLHLLTTPLFGALLYSIPIALVIYLARCGMFRSDW